MMGRVTSRTGLFLGIPLLFGFLIWTASCNHQRHQADYDSLITAAARRHGMSPSLIKAVIHRESRFQSYAVGGAGEVGLMQLMPGAAKDWARVNRRPVPERLQLFDPELNIEIGTWYLAHCRKHFSDYVSRDILALAAYNAGYSRVKKWKPENPETPMDIEAIKIASTRKYVRTILKYRELYTYLDEAP